jgi:hypothetical protein
MEIGGIQGARRWLDAWSTEIWRIENHQHLQAARVLGRDRFSGGHLAPFGRGRIVEAIDLHLERLGVL